MHIRFAIFNDILSIHQLAHQIWWPTYRDILSDEQIEFMLEKMYSEVALKSQFDAGIQFLVAEINELPVGFAAYSLINSETAIFKLHKIYLLPTQQGKGSGKNFMEYIVKLVKAQSGKTLELNVNRKNPALSFYQKSGFEIYQSVDIPFYQFEMNDYVMRLELV